MRENMTYYGEKKAHEMKKDLFLKATGLNNRITSFLPFSFFSFKLFLLIGGIVNC